MDAVKRCVEFFLETSSTVGSGNMKRKYAKQAELKHIHHHHHHHHHHHLYIIVFALAIRLATNWTYKSLMTRWNLVPLKWSALPAVGVAKKSVHAFSLQCNSPQDRSSGRFCTLLYAPLAPIPFSPVQRHRKFSAVIGTTSALKVISRRPAAAPPMEMSKYTTRLSPNVT